MEQIRLTTSLPPRPAHPPTVVTDGYPVSLVLSDGEDCVQQPDTASTPGNVDPDRPIYTCGAGTLYGPPDRARPTWTATFTAAGSTTRTQVAIASASF